MADFPQFLITGLLIGGIYALVAVGFVIIYKSSSILNFAQGQVVLIGAYLSWFLIDKAGLPIWAGILLTMVAAILLGIAVERFPLRPMVGQSMLSLIMATLGLSLFLQAFVTMFWGNVKAQYPQILPLRSVRIWGMQLSEQHLWAFLICMTIIGLLLLFFRYTKTGLVMRATAQSHPVAQSLGINVNRVIAISLAIAFAVAVVAGIILANIGNLDISLSNIGLAVIAAVFIGGLESIGGAVLGGLLIGVVQIMATRYIGFGSGDVSAYIILAVVLVIRPYGLFGLKKIERV